MSKFWRALLVSAVATGAAVVVMKLIEPETPPAAPPADKGSGGAYVDADTMTKEEQDLLMQELEGHL